jgi:ATP-dependent Clp protease ATP-binding subunit ClpC
MDEAGAVVKLRHSKLPEDVAEVQKRIHFIDSRMKSAITNHEFEKARFYSEEERKERERLREVRAKYKLDETKTAVTREDIEGVIARWTGATTEAIRKSRPA